MRMRDLGGCMFLLVLCVIFSASSAQRGPKLFQGKLSTTAKPKQNNKKFGSNLKDYEDYEDYYDYYDYYYDEDPLPSGPTRRPAPAAKSLKPLRFPEPEYDYYEEEPLPSGPTREPPLPSGPTRRPGQARTFSPKPRNTDSSALNQFLNLPLLTTQRPRKLKVAKSNSRKTLLEQLGPFHQHFIAPPKLNAGVLPLAFESSLPLNRFPPFNKPATANRGDTEMRR
eukprot:TRINITY_DN848_c0_g1_i2.p1 TRINITY_DN848_c0_g1~~TRINITY_DN848_c0_g1_i2.p1  ORF type:complete len:225 (-),score=61.27 TRINITY_DN848_c0_g1_i2:67-741(-)